MILSSSLIASCNKTTFKEEDKEIEIITKARWGRDAYVRLIEIDSCEYLVSTRNDAISIIHKQNCKYCSFRKKSKL